MELKRIKELNSKIDFKKAKTYPLKSRKCKVSRDDFGAPSRAKGQSFSDFIESLPKIQSAKDLAEFAEIITAAHKAGKKIIAAIGGHVIKTGVTPYLIELINMGVIAMISMNGAAAIHDFEIAINGRTSEDVAEALQDGTFGMARETGFYFNRALFNAKENSSGAGFELYKAMDELKAPFVEDSIIFNAFNNNIPATVHIAVGTDIVHVHPETDGEAIGSATFNDFKTYCAMISELGEGAVYINFGSAVVMPEVFLKALTLTRNLGYKTFGFHTANFDMITHYRPVTNVLSRPTIGSGGRSFNFNGCHEIMIPLLYSILNEKLRD